jgi:hypothetical protein
MRIRNVTSGGWAVGAVLLLAVALTVPVAVALAAGPDTYARPQVVAQVATPTPFRFLTPTPIVPGSTASTTSAATPPRAGGFPMELALPVLVVGMAAIGGGSFLLRRRTARL